MINNKKRYNAYIYFYSFYYLIFIPSIMFLLVSTIIFNSLILSYAQNLSGSISLKANAGEDQYVEEGKPVILNAEDSVSSDPPIDSYSWLQLEPKDPKVELENSNTSRASFTSPNLPNPGNIAFQLIVKDNNITDTDTVNIYVVEDLSTIDKLKEGGPTNYQPEICFDGSDNDLDGKIDVQDEECGMTFIPENPSQIPFPPHIGGGSNLPNSQFGQILPPNQMQPQYEQAQPGQINPGQGQIIP
jgi:hypothetical protein